MKVVPIGDAVWTTEQLIERFEFEMRVMFEFVDLLDSPGAEADIAEASRSIKTGIGMLVEHAGLKTAPSVADYMTEKIWPSNPQEDAPR